MGMKNINLLSSVFLCASLLCGPVGAACAQTNAASPSDSLMGRYLARVTATQSEQPHWITPLVTVTPRLEQEFRTDFVHQDDTQAYGQWNYGNGKGLEFIPQKQVEMLVNLPPFVAHDHPGVQDGFGDVSLMMKYRIFAHNEETGNSIITAFLSGSIPTGKNGNGSCCAIVTPTLAMGKGFGRFDYTTTIGGSLPVTNAAKLGHTITWNNAWQYKIGRLFWPELESNTNFYRSGANDGKVQSFLTPGIVMGRFPLHNRIGLTVGAGEQIAVTRFHTYNHSLVLTARMPF